MSATYAGALRHIVVDAGAGLKIDATVSADQDTATLAKGAPVWLSWDPTATMSVSHD